MAHTLTVLEIAPNTTSNILVGVARNPDMRIVTTTANCFLKFLVNEINPQTKATIASYDDEYQLEDLELTVSDYINTFHFTKPSFQQAWESFDSSLEQVQSYQLQYKTLELAMAGLVKHFGEIF